MRIIAGKARGLKLECPRGREVRPTPDMAREALFNILGDGVAGAHVLDLFAGTGTVGIEALSRGAQSCVFVERSPGVRRFLEGNLARARVAEFSDVVPGDVLGSLHALNGFGRSFGIVFLGPPFGLWRDAKRSEALLDFLDRLVQNGLLDENCVVIAQHEVGVDLPELTARVRQFDRRKYGRNVFSFYRLRGDLEQRE